MKYLLPLLFPLIIFSQENSLVGDVDCSGDITSQDAVLILQYVTSVINELPCESNMTGLTPEQLQEMINMMDEQLSINYTGGSVGGCDFLYPEKDNIDPVNHIFSIDGDFVVPDGKHFYMLHENDWNYNYSDIYGPTIAELQNDKPLIFDSGYIIFENDGSGRIGGYLVDANPTITPVNHFFNIDGDFVVPDGKHFYMLHENDWNNNWSDIYGSSIADMSSGKPLIFDSGNIIFENDGSGRIGGYLVDEDYFDNCSGGGANNSVNPQNNNGASNSNTLMYTIDGF